MRQYDSNFLGSILDRLQKSLYAEEMVCAMSSQLFHIPQTKNLEGNAEMHEHLIPASYHRVTAVGSALRLVQGESDHSIFETLTACVKNAIQKDTEVRKGILIMLKAASQQLKPFIEQILKWQDQTEYELQNAQNQLKMLSGYTTQYS